MMPLIGQKTNHVAAVHLLPLAAVLAWQSDRIVIYSMKSYSTAECLNLLKFCMMVH